MHSAAEGELARGKTRVWQEVHNLARSTVKADFDR